MDDKEVSDSPDKAATVGVKDVDKLEDTSSAGEVKVTESGDNGKVIESDDISKQSGDIAKVTESENVAKVTDSDENAKVTKSAESTEATTESGETNSGIKSSSNVNSESLSEVDNSVDHEIRKEGNNHETLTKTVADEVDSVELGMKIFNHKQNCLKDMNI